jgi:GntR family transcriptional regulator
MPADKYVVNHTSASQRLHEELGNLIAATKPGDRLPTEPKLAKELGVSRATLREAMRTFETQGMIRRRQGSGTFVTHPTQIIESGLEVLESIESIAERIGLEVQMGRLTVEQRVPTAAEARALQLDKGCEVLSLTRVMLAEGRPVAYLIDIIPDCYLKETDLDENFTGSVLDLLKTSLMLQSSRCEISAVTATSQVAKALGIQRGDVLLRFEAILYSEAGDIVDYSFSYFLPGVFRFHVVRKVG